LKEVAQCVSFPKDQEFASWLPAGRVCVGQRVCAQQEQQQQRQSDSNIVVYGESAPAMTAGPEVKGVITARNDDKMKVRTADGNSVSSPSTILPRSRPEAACSAGTSKLGADSLLNGLPVTVKTLQSGDGQPGGELVASQISLRKNDLKTATMIRNATDQRFEEQTAATESLRGRLGDIDKYNIKGTTNVHFDTGKAELSDQDKAQLCSTAPPPRERRNALILVVGYTDSTGSDDVNQELSEKRANRVINYLQQKCGWKPYRMLTPTGMATADPLASNDTEGRQGAEPPRRGEHSWSARSVDGEFLIGVAAATALAPRAFAAQRGPLVLAAASLQESMNAAADAWARKGHARPVLSFAASSALARQVAAGAAADLFVSADEPWMDDVQRRGLIVPGTRANLARQSAGGGAACGARPVERQRRSGACWARGRIALADPGSVPAGRYAQASLTSSGCGAGSRPGWCAPRMSARRWRWSSAGG
jgi:OOP family OmpA-OmpF porin